jgi:hypothetical protein
MACKGRSILDAFAALETLHARQVQQHREARSTLDQRSNRGALQAKDKVALPMSRYGTFSNFGRPLADHDFIVDKRFPAIAGPFAWYAQGSPGTQARAEFTA